MPSFVLFILPAMAIAFVGYMLLRPICCLLGFSKLKQQVHGDGRSIRQAAIDRGQEDEHETLLALGFIPLGIYRESVWGMGDGQDQHVFTHRELPVVCSLCQNIDQELYVVLTSDDANGRLIRTSTSAAAFKSDTRDCFAHAVEAETMEQVFVAHIRMLDQWEQQGFQPTRVETLDSVKQHYQRAFENSGTQQVMRVAHTTIAGGFMTFGLGFPVFAAAAVSCNAARWGHQFSPAIMTQITAVASLAGSYWIYRHLDHSKVPTKNSIGEHNSNLSLVETNAGTTF